MCGLAEYSAQFELGGITGRRLLLLDEVALREMGVSKWGHRKQILRRTAEARHSSRRRLRGRPAVAQWSERDVCDWLKLIQLADYRQVFVDHRIDGRRLTALTDTALVEDMGITTLGHRKRILKELRAAIAAGATAAAHHQRKAKPDSPELGRTKSKRKRAELDRP
ncbi:SAM domain (Sterile alpha motif) domain containing protein [Acanthamoeba castellanii str. Neff]|uniref:SAM domain (Sterile alpha motif) domain containing protein n=1 Tax=Acanthamoeba castellanii (strain ATCC 30010 / Neff) TaxID=1257118 RepID=L8GLP3_ACACF|nr:SAM domain (Sterile alpha motif) domain containing protein [Acanthamoeba castellanii str. Neff]ELR13101.1 SAM domain (Sterile alpha motif) domain containing protein [Acanthamoeba castellanii str. Neff]